MKNFSFQSHNTCCFRLKSVNRFLFSGIGSHLDLQLTRIYNTTTKTGIKTSQIQKISFCEKLATTSNALKTTELFHCFFLQRLYSDMQPFFNETSNVTSNK